MGSKYAYLIPIKQNKYSLSFRGLSTLHDSVPLNSKPTILGNLGRRNRNSIPIPYRTIPEPRGQDLDFVNVVYSHLIHSDWDKLGSLSTHLTTSRVKYVLLKIQKDHVLSLDFFNWVKTINPSFLSLETHASIVHILTKHRKFKSAELILRSIILSGSIEVPPVKLFEAILYSYRTCDSSPRVFDSLFKTYAHMKKFRCATDTFCQMKDFGFLPNVESCNAYLSSLLELNRVDIALVFYSEMRRCRISPNVYTLNMMISGYCKSGKLDKSVEMFREMESLGFSPNVTTYNTLIAGHCEKSLLSFAMKLKSMMGKNGLEPNVVTFNTLIHGFCKVGKLNEANKVFSEMKKSVNVVPNIVTYNSLINGCSCQAGNTEMGNRFFEEMVKNGVKPDILTYNALISGLCKEGKTKKAAYLVKELDNKNLVPNASTFSALISGQCARRNSDRAFQIYKSMIRSGCHPNENTFRMLVSCFCKNEDFDGAVQVIKEMIDKAMASDSVFVCEIFNGLQKSGKDGLAMKLYNEMEAKHLIPEGFDINTIHSTTNHPK